VLAAATAYVWAARGAGQAFSVLLWFLSDVPQKHFWDIKDTERSWFMRVAFRALWVWVCGWVYGCVRVDLWVGASVCVHSAISMHYEWNHPKKKRKAKRRPKSVRPVPGK
jgi:hypothetical protein